MSPAHYLSGYEYPLDQQSETTYCIHIISYTVLVDINLIEN
jgi:hypothetical protein